MSTVKDNEDKKKQKKTGEYTDTKRDVHGFVFVSLFTTWWDFSWRINNGCECSEPMGKDVFFGV